MRGVILPRLALLSLAGILVLAAGKGEASDAKPGQEKPAGTVDLRPKIDDLPLPQKPDVNVIIDRVATRLGAFAVVAIASSPVLQLGWALLNTWPYHLPSTREAILIILVPLIVLALLIALFILGFVTVLALLDLLDGRQNRRSLLWRSFLVFVGIWLLIVIFAAVMKSDEIAPSFISTAEKLHLAPDACGPSRLTGRACEAAINAELAKQDLRWTKAIEDAVARALAKEAAAR